MVPKELIISFGDLHLYKNHFEQAKIQLSREPLWPAQFPHKPLFDIPFRENLSDYVYEDFYLENYNPLPAIPAPIAV